VPSATDAGVPGIEALLWFGLMAPARTPQAIVIKLNQEIRESFGRADTKDALLKLDADEETAKLLIELGVSKFVPATPKDYEGNEKLLKAYLGY